MPTLFEKAAGWTKERLDLKASIPVTVRDGNLAIDNVLATPGNSQFATLNIDEYVGSEKTFDWLFSAEDLNFMGEKREPKTGWEIWLPLEGNRRAIYQAVAAENGRCFDVMDHLGVLLRVHTSLLRIENV